MPRFLFIAPAPAEIYTLSLHDALPILPPALTVIVPWLVTLPLAPMPVPLLAVMVPWLMTSTEPASELQAQTVPASRPTLEQKKKVRVTPALASHSALAPEPAKGTLPVP